MKTKTLSLIAAGLIGLSSSLLGQVTPSATLSSYSIADGGSLTFYRTGDTPLGFAWSEATLWHPGSGYTVLGIDYTEDDSQLVTPTAGPGTYWIQFRLVDSTIDYQDQWISFTVTAAAPTPDGSLSSYSITDGECVTFYRNGSTPGGFGWSEAVLWNPDSSATNLGNAGYNGYSQDITPSNGPGTYYIQYRLVDVFQNYTDQVIQLDVYPCP